MKTRFLGILGALTLSLLTACGGLTPRLPPPGPPPPAASPTPSPTPAPAPTPAPTPAPPAVRWVAVVVVDSDGRPVPGARAELADTIEPHAGATDGNGYVAWPGVLASLRASQLTIAAAGFQPYSAHVDLRTDGNEDLPRVTLQRVAAILTSGEEHGFLHFVGQQPFDEAGHPWQWGGCTDFSLLLRSIRGESLDALLTDRVAAGCRVLRVLGMMEHIARLHPQDVPDYLAQVVTLVRALAARGLRIEFVVFADAQLVMPDLLAQQTHLAQVVGVLQDQWNALLELCNECEKNGVDPARFQRPPPPLAAAHGSPLGEGLPILPAWSYAPIHGSRKADWPRDAKGSQDVRDGWRCIPDDAGCVPFPGTHVYVVQDEPMGFADVDQPGRRSANCDDAAFFGAAAALFGGATFHSDNGIQSEIFSATQRACAVAFFQGLRFVPANASIWPYQRGGADGGAGIGNMPLQHWDVEDPAHAQDGALRTFCKSDLHTEWCVALRPGPQWRAIGRDGWRVVEEPRRGLVRLER